MSFYKHKKYKSIKTILFSKKRMSARYVKVAVLTPDPNGIDAPDGREKPLEKGKYWRIVRHNGVIFPPDYVPLPDSVKIKVQGRPFSLDTRKICPIFNMCAEEGAYLYAKFMELDLRNAKEKSKYERTTTLPEVQKAFWDDWRVILKQSGSPIKNFRDADFTPIVEYIALVNDAKKNKKEARSELKKKLRSTKDKEEASKIEIKLRTDYLDAEEKEKERKKEVKELYGFVILDGVKLPLAGYQIQPPQIFKGHKGNPNLGRIYGRMSPNDVRLNVSLKYVPECSNRGMRCQWGEVIEKPSVQWLAEYRNPITNKLSNMMIKRSASMFVKSADRDKFDIARILEKNIDRVVRKYVADMNSPDIRRREEGTAVYLLDVLAIRPGAEKDDNSADTRGLTTLLVENITFYKDRHIGLSFLGKSSVQDTRTLQIDGVAWKNLRELCAGKSKSEKIFSLTDDTLNAYVHTLLPTSDVEKRLTSKVFRTRKASSILQRLLDRIPDDISRTEDAKVMFDKANQEVAIRLNHKIVVDDKTIQKIRDIIKTLEGKQGSTARQEAGRKKSLEIARTKLKALEEGISISTSKQNYIDPRIVVAYCKRVELPIERLFSKLDCDKFAWAMSIESDWDFNVL